MTESNVSILYSRESTVYTKLFGQNEIKVVSDFNSLNDKMYVTFGVEMKGIPIYDIKVIEKIILYEKSKTLENISQRYFQKRPPTLNTPKQNLNFLERIFKAQRKEIKRLGLSQAVNFEVRMSKYLAYFNHHAVLVDKGLLHKDISSMEMKPCNLSSKSQVVAYLKSKGFDANIKNWYLKSLNDAELDNYIHNRSIRSKIGHLTLILDRDAISINHAQYGSVTGRMTTANPNAIGLKKYIKGLSGIDYVAQEAMIYKHYFEPKALDDFNGGDLNGFITANLFGIKGDYNQVKKSHPSKRAFVKLCILQCMNGQDRKGFRRKFGSKLLPLFEKFLAIMEFDSNRKLLLSYATGNGKYRACDWIGKTISDRYSIEHSYLKARYKKALEEYKDLCIARGIKFNHPDKGFVRDYGWTSKDGHAESTYRENIRNMKSVVMNRLVQTTGAVITKRAVMRCIDYIVKNDIDNSPVMVVYDDIKFKNNNSLEELGLEMKIAYKEVMKKDIDIDIRWA